MKNYKKITLLSLLFLFCFSTKLFAIGAGVQVSGNPGLLINEEGVKLERLSGRLTGTIRFSRLPLAIGFGLEAGKNASDFSYGFSGFADYYAIDYQIKNTWNLYSGFGAEGSLLTTNFDKWTLTAGARFFVGMNWLFYDNYLEIYCQQNLVPSYIKNLNDIASKGGFLLGLPFEAGIRMHF